MREFNAALVAPFNSAEDETRLPEWSGNLGGQKFTGTP
jgi:hypothetical protein